LSNYQGFTLSGIFKKAAIFKLRKKREAIIEKCRLWALRLPIFRVKSLSEVSLTKKQKNINLFLIELLFKA